MMTTQDIGVRDRKRRVSRYLAAVLAALLMTLTRMGVGGGVLPAAAASNCANNNNCAWTQIDNNNWQPNANMDPSCHSSCKMWQQNCDARLGYWNTWSGTGNLFERKTDWAVNMWNAVAECTPNYTKTGNTSAPIQYNATSMGRYGWCGSTSANGYQSGSFMYIQSVTINLNTDKDYFDGPVPNGNDHGCDVGNVLLHETGHSFGEGHSSVSSDIMYPVNTDVMSIDADAHHMLAATYGYDSPNGCSSCQFNAVPMIDFGLPPIQQMGLGYFQQATTDKANAAVGAAQSTEQGAGSMANNGVGYAKCADYTVTGACFTPPQPKP